MALVCWLLSSIGVAMSLLGVTGAAVVSLVRDATVGPVVLIGMAIPYAWLSLYFMGRAWVAGRPAAWHWYTLGSFAGALCAAFFWPFAWICAPALALGIYLTAFHLMGKPPQAGSGEVKPVATIEIRTWWDK
ncbi:hypothetical protein M4R22_05265 [Acidovorax sp. GBBC 3334]|uniref:hypothetical protein n=1 Tax=Acidovorax sp. GBBC 3334 TaxID=2940496 RepID=UPI0023029699|nr:hypothetical protein [Acidovorax sp. GBBC 3334]MDA8454165.1 hypothetical protein [Acidovorax sp. GBBC 3334]